MKNLGEKWLPIALPHYRITNFCLTPDNGCVANIGRRELVKYDNTWLEENRVEIWWKHDIRTIACQSNGNIVGVYTIAHNFSFGCSLYSGDLCSIINTVVLPDLIPSDKYVNLAIDGSNQILIKTTLRFYLYSDDLIHLYFTYSWHSKLGADMHIDNRGHVHILEHEKLQNKVTVFV